MRKSAATLFYDKWRADRVFALVPAGATGRTVHADHGRIPATAESPESWSVSHVMEKLRSQQQALESGKGMGVK